MARALLRFAIIDMLLPVCQRATSAAVSGCVRWRSLGASSSGRAALVAVRRRGSGAAARHVRTAAAQQQQERKDAGHQVPQSSVVSEEATDPEIVAYREHQASAARLTLAEEARTLVHAAR